MNGRRGGAAWAMAAVLAVAAAARVPFLADSLWYDEVAAFLTYGAQGPVHALTTYVSLANHVLQSAAAAASAQALGADELSLRLPSLLAGLGAVAATWWFARVAVSGALGPWAGAAMALMPVAVLPSTEARGYAMVTLFAALAHGAFVAARRDGAARMWALWAAACALGTWTHLVAACVPAFHAAWLALDAVRAKDPEAAKDLEALPDTLRDLIADPQVLGALDEAASDLRNAAAELRAQTAALRAARAGRGES